MKKKHICKNCQFYTPNNIFKDRGSCKEMGDANDLDFSSDEFPSNLAMGWDYEGYRAGVYVGPEFGCIHWLGKKLPRWVGWTIQTSE